VRVLCCSIVGGNGIQHRWDGIYSILQSHHEHPGNRQTAKENIFRYVIMDCRTQVAHLVAVRPPPPPCTKLGLFGIWTL